MKKLILAMLIALTAVGIVSAQNWGFAPQTPAALQQVSVQGTLGLQNGIITLSSGNTTYYVPQISRYVGFIDGLKEGAQVKVEGWQSGGGYITLSKLTVGGKDYDLSPISYGGYNGYGMGHCGGWGHSGGRGRGYW